MFNFDGKEYDLPNHYCYKAAATYVEHFGSDTGYVHEKLDDLLELNCGVTALVTLDWRLDDKRFKTFSEKLGIKAETLRAICHHLREIH